MKSYKMEEGKMKNNMKSIFFYRNRNLTTGNQKKTKFEVIN